MSIIKPIIDEWKDIFLHTTKVENLFINEFLPDAPGDYVKVYLFGLMYAQYEQAIDSSILSMILGLSEEEIDEAWIYWESRGLVKFKKKNTVKWNDKTITGILYQEGKMFIESQRGGQAFLICTHPDLLKDRGAVV